MSVSYLSSKLKKNTKKEKNHKKPPPPPPKKPQTTTTTPTRFVCKIKQISYEFNAHPSDNIIC